ncbi:hypothetical protein [Vibrio fortis]|uniref:hypothetical protein n=1 Tax=Vibrio fortis TaxID=212667 RepID=UPI0038CDB530
MKELVNAITQATANRLKSPIIGSFLLSWLVVNHNSVLTFIFSNSEQKLELLKQDTAFWTTTPTLLESPVFLLILYPSVLALVYTFGLPYLQYKIDYHKFRRVDLTRLREKHRNQRAIYKSQKITSKAQAESAPEYWKDKLTRDLNNWEQQREGLLSDLDALRADRDALQKDRDAVQKDRDALHKDRELVMNDKDAIQNDRDHVVADRDKLIEEISRLESKYQTISNDLTNVSSKNKELTLSIEQREETISSLQTRLEQFVSGKNREKSLQIQVAELEKEITNKEKYIEMYERQVETLANDFTELYDVSQKTIDNISSIDFQERLIGDVGLESPSRRGVLQLVINEAMQPMVDLRDSKHVFKRLEDIRQQAKGKNDEQIF